MARIALDLSQFKSAGVYTVEVDKSERITVSTQSLRLVPGFSARGPYNAPVFIRSGNDLRKFYGPLDTKLERKGSFFHRSINTCLLASPVFAINLLNPNQDPTIDKDKVEYTSLSLDSDASNGEIYDDLYVNFFNKERFWRPDEDYLQGIVNNSVGAANNLSAPLFSIVNIGNKNLSFIIKKATGLAGYDITAKDWYGTEGDIPYPWIRPYDLLEDYFIQVIAVEGDWTDYSKLSSDPYYSDYFNSNGLIPSQINNFIQDNQVNLLGSWTGTIIPDFRDQTGSEQYIETVVNGSVSLAGVFMNVNQEALDQLIWNEDSQQWETGDGEGTDAAPYLVDLVGHNLMQQTTFDPSANISNNFLSYDIDVSAHEFQEIVNITLSPNGELTGKEFYIDVSDNSKISMGSYVKKESGGDIAYGVTKVVSKIYTSDVSTSTSPNGVYILETLEPIADYTDPATEIIVQKQLDDPSVNNAYKIIQLDGLKIVNRHLPGFDEDGGKSAEEGVNKIYGMLHDKGILRGLTNPDMINFRYVVDTMAYGLRSNMGGKSWLSSLAKKRGKCTALLNAPSIKQFAASQNPYFCNTYVPGVDPVPIFSTEFIPQGGNPDMPRSFRFTLPNEELGSKYCGVFGPFLKYNENGKLINVPPAADVSNTFARKYLGGNPYAIMANRNGILSNPQLSGVEYMIDKEDRDYLEPFGYNSIIERPATSQVMIYANATAYQNVKSDYNNLHVRELLNTLEIQIDEVLRNYVFDFNNPITRLNIINNVAPILESVKDAGAISKYILTMDETNNPEDIIAEGFGIIDIDLWITGALTKIIARYSVNSDGAVSSGGVSGN